MNFWRTLFLLTGWKVDVTVPNRKKAIICVAPHTSNWDFLIGLIAYRSLGRKARFLMKKFWFFFPLKYLLKTLGGIPVRRSSFQSLTSQLIEKFKLAENLTIAITPEGTRKPIENWHSGFIRIAYESQVPIQLGVIDYRNKLVFIHEEFFPTSNVDEDMKSIRNYYSKFKDRAKYPGKFIP